MMSLRQRLLSAIQSMSPDNPLPLRLVFWDGQSFDFAPRPNVVLTIHSRSVVRAFMTGRIDKLGDAYVKGDITVDGEVHDILDVGIRLSERFSRFSRFAEILRPLRFFRFRHSKNADAAAIRHHYDAPQEFYQPWLDRSLTYSCAYFPTGTEDIDTAQRAKIDHICRKLRLGPQDEVLDIGCGWGALLIHASRTYGVRGVGVTNSPAQFDYARRSVKNEGLDNRIEIRLQDYREIESTERYDKIVSVGMYEHVGVSLLPIYFETLFRLLKPGGALLNHGIVNRGRRVASSSTGMSSPAAN
jgi:cyclopropane-fatty-acyl-phospholipid synthase